MNLCLGSKIIYLHKLGKDQKSYTEVAAKYTLIVI